MKRIALFLGTNIAVLVVLAVVMQVFGLESYLHEHGGIDLQALLIFSAIIGFSGAFISLAISKWSAKWMTKAHVITQPRNAQESWLLNTVQRQAQQCGIRCPEVAIYESPEPNAFATGPSRNNSLVAVSRGLLLTMTRDEVEAVLAHEVSHVSNGDMVTMTLLQGVINTFVIFLSRIIGYVVDRVVFKNERGHGPGFFITAIIAQILLGMLASTIVMWFSRKREFRADAGGARLAGRAKMIAALERLRSIQQPPQLPDSVAAFGIRGNIGQGIKRLFMSHPPLEERIAALQRHV